MKRKQKINYDKNAHQLPELEVGDTVRIKPTNRLNKEWEQGQILKKLDFRSYLVKTQKNRTIRRNRRHLRKTIEKFEVKDDEDDHDYDWTPPPATNNNPNS